MCDTIRMEVLLKRYNQPEFSITLAHYPYEQGWQCRILHHPTGEHVVGKSTVNPYIAVKRANRLASTRISDRKDGKFNHV